METQKETFEGWAILELMGHRRLAGNVREVSLFGGSFCRIDIPGPNNTTATQYYGASSIYALTPTTEDIARAVATREQPEPAHRWELPQLAAPKTSTDAEFEN